MNGRPVTDSPKWEGPLYEIKIKVDGEWQLFSLCTDEDTHIKMIHGMIDHGYYELMAQTLQKPVGE